MKKLTEKIARIKNKKRSKIPVMSIKICIMYAIFMLAWIILSSIIADIMKNPAIEYDYIKYKNILITIFILISPFIIYFLSKYILYKSGYERCKKVESLLKAEKNLSNCLLDNVPCMIIFWKSDGTIKKVNTYAENVLEYTAEELTGKKWFEIYLPKYLNRKKFKTNKKHDAEKVFSSLGSNKEFRIKTKSGKIIYTLWNSTLIRDGNGNITDIISVGTDITHRRKAEKNLHNLAYYDLITDLPNRANFEKKLKKLIRESNPDFKFALVYVDIDNFKKINDTMGHLYGDLLLKEVANVMVNEVKAPDLAARLGGDEFGIVIYQYKSVEEIEKYLNDLLECLKEPLIIDGNKIKVTISMGVSFYPAHGKCLSDLLQKADIALYNVKQRGKNGFSIYCQHA